MPLPRSIRNRNQKFDKNITKRGHVDPGKIAKRNDEFPVSSTLIIFFLVVVVGSSLVQIFNLFGGSASKPPME
ncbi:ribosome associated membrane protein RAMP4 [Nitzschia inconspicua]|uniref:Ribosome associated membrane protein RAMP4 n=1 Tax=Nitzschia inconspicua TaxID=303405 RepID=A0A9K3PVU8_9STRA|nr:ribosome associated membrane protein RAMP4 [Nitzschia inconspicua]